MDRTKARRRRIAFGVLIGAAIGAFALGATLGNGRAPKGGVGGDEPSPQAKIVSALPASQLAGLRIVVGITGAEVSPDLRTAIRRGHVAGVVLFASSFPSRQAGRRLISRLQGIRRPPPLRAPLLIMVDQEGGLVKRVGGAPTASARQMGNRGAAFSREQGRRTAANLRDLGVNVNLAPVLDLAQPGGTIATTERGFGATAARVTATAIPFAKGLEAGGVAATAKHFPGLGAARENTDDAVETIALSRARLRAVDEAPFRAFAAAGGALVMMSTAIYPAFSNRPAAFARQIATGELRRRLGFEGVSVTDALGTAAVVAFGGPAKAGLAAVRAGTDLLMFNDLVQARRAWRVLVSNLSAGRLDRNSFEVSAARVLELRAGLPRR